MSNAGICAEPTSHITAVMPIVLPACVGLLTRLSPDWDHMGYLCLEPPEQQELAANM